MNLFAISFAPVDLPVAAPPSHEICKKLELKPSDCVIFGIGGDKFSAFERAGVNRVCLSNVLIS